MPRPSHNQLARRERQIMEIVYRLGRATAADVLAELPDPPSYSAVRARARRSALTQVVQTFFDGSAEQAVAALLDLSHEKLSDDDLDRLSGLIDKARQEGR